MVLRSGEDFLMVESTDAGSLPFAEDLEQFSRGVSLYGRLVNESTAFFERKVVDSFLDKARAGINVPTYPQFRDMNEMFLEMMEGVEEVGGRYLETAVPSLRDTEGLIPEVLAIKNNTLKISERLGEPFRLRVSVTGPYTLSSFFAYRDRNTFTRLAGVLSKIVEGNIFKNKHGGVSLIALDEPVFGLIDDPLLDRGSEARENLLKAWESIFQKARSSNVQTSLHLHKTSDELFWEAKTLTLIESHVNDPLYQAKRTKELLESRDKFLKASLATTDFDQLIRESVIASSQPKPSEIAINEKIAEAWKSINDKKIEPTTFLESVNLMSARLVKIVEHFGENRVLYAGPECGLKGFPTNECALECLRRVSRATKDMKR